MTEPVPENDLSFYGKRNLIALLAGSGIYAICYVLLMVMSRGDGSSALLFIVMPILSTWVVARLTPSPTMIYRTSFASMFFNLVLSPFMFGEGAFCIIMAAPIFATMVAITAWAVHLVRRERVSVPINPAKTLLLMLGLAVLAGAVWDEVTLRNGAPVETVRSEVEIPAPRAEVWKRLTFDRVPVATVPMWLKLWVKQPERYAFSATGIGARRETDFGEPRYGDDADAIRNKLIYEIAEWQENDAVTFVCKENHSRMRNWIDLLDTRVQLSDASGGATHVVFTTRYRRRVGPSLYFTPFLNAATRGTHVMLGQEMGAPQK
ncbi:MAG: SRPBCC family protein [Planctomycetota bacterium]